MMKFSRQHRNPPVRHPLIDEVSDGGHHSRPRKNRLQSSWKMVDGRLVCHWETVQV